MIIELYAMYCTMYLGLFDYNWITDFVTQSMHDRRLIQFYVYVVPLLVHFRLQTETA